MESGFPAGARVLVEFEDGAVLPATVLRSQEDGYAVRIDPGHLRVSDPVSTVVPHSRLRRMPAESDLAAPSQ